ncbi:MAG: cytochrome c-type biogenesis protein CcmH [Actinobacteria bacterium]|nr:cytochrome c-type biogenesis protein CcmH [Actinomycetota bacterium]MBV9665504.1 cytochrome c-type biogenesis protein CcmH [Actinomycetota bacterium]
MKRWLPWLLGVVVVIVALVVGTSSRGGAQTATEKAASIEKGVRCPTCRELSVAESDARAAQAIRAEILRRVKAGQSPSTIRAFLVSRYGPDILLKPQGKGVAALVWVLPVVAFLIALTGLILAFRRWRDLP